MSQFPSVPVFRRGTAVALALACVSSACSGRPDGLPAEPQPVPARVTLAPGQAASFGANGEFRVTFREIEADSRCPSDAQCVWAGDAAVLLRLERGGIRAGTTLHTTLTPQRVVFDGDFAVGLVSVSPAPSVAAPIPAQQYRVTIEVTTP